MHLRDLAHVLLWTAATTLCAPSRAADPYYVAADPRALAVTPQNVLASERFWPYQLELVEPWQAEEGAEPLPPGTLAVLVRIEDDGAARLDFGRDGLDEVPVGKTDLVERANRIRRGELAKIAPNLAHALGPRLLDPAPPTLRAFDFPTTFEPPGFLCVFVDPGSPAFGDLVAALSPLRGRYGVMTVLFPQGNHPHAATREKLRGLDWRVPFLMDQFSEPYTRSLLPDGATPPAVMLATREGRVVFQSPWREGVAAALSAALDRRFGGERRTTADARPASAP